jgi:hypothetical protein
VQPDVTKFVADGCSDAMIAARSVNALGNLDYRSTVVEQRGSAVNAFGQIGICVDFGGALFDQPD